MSNKNILKINSTNQNEAGFTLIEAVVAILILTIGLVGTAAAMTYALQFSIIGRNVTRAKFVVAASIEEIESLRNSRRLDFKQIANAGAVDNVNSPNQFAGFTAGLQPVSKNPGPDGVNGTADDLSVATGADGIYGTGDDVRDLSLSRTEYSRQITVTSLSPSLKKVVVRVQYQASGDHLGEITGVSYINDDARITR